MYALEKIIVFCVMIYAQEELDNSNETDLLFRILPNSIMNLQSSSFENETIIESIIKKEEAKLEKAEQAEKAAIDLLMSRFLNNGTIVYLEDVKSKISDIVQKLYNERKRNELMKINIIKNSIFLHNLKRTLYPKGQRIKTKLDSVEVADHQWVPVRGDQ